MVAADLAPKFEIGEPCFSEGLIKVTCKCDEDAVRKGHFVTATDAEQFPPDVHEADAGEQIYGVALKLGNTGEYIPVMIQGIVKMYAGAAVVTSDVLKSDAEGRAIPIAATNVKMEGGVAMMKAGEADDEFIVFVSQLCHIQVIA